MFLEEAKRYFALSPFEKCYSDMLLSETHTDYILGILSDQPIYVEMNTK